MAGSVIENVTKLSFASERMQAAERAHNFVVGFSSNDFNRRRGVAMSITVSISARPDSNTGRWGRWDVERSPFSSSWYRSLCGHRPSLLSKAPRISSQLFTDWNDLLVDSQSLCSYSIEQIRVPPSTFMHLLCGFYLNPKAPKLIIPPADWSTAVTSHADVNSDARSIQISSQNIQIQNAKQACKQPAAVQ